MDVYKGQNKQKSYKRLKPIPKRVQTITKGIKMNKSKENAIFVLLLCVLMLIVSADRLVQARDQVLTEIKTSIIQE
jgi:hypothetical protein